MENIQNICCDKCYNKIKYLIFKGIKNGSGILNKLKFLGRGSGYK